VPLAKHSRAATLWLAACGAIALAAMWATAAEAIVLPQADGGELVLKSPAQRLITLSPHLTELVFAAGAGHLLAATVAYSDFPPEASELPRVGDAFRIDSERVHLLDPDLILGWQSGNPPAALSHLTGLGFPLWTLEIRRPGEIADVVEMIGQATGTLEAARTAAGDLRRKIAELERRYAARNAVSYFYQISDRPLYTVSGEHLISRGLALCGGENVFADLSGLAPQIGLEAVLLADPQLLIAPRIGGLSDPLEHWRAWPRLQAVRDQHFLLLPADEISRATPRFLDSVELACAMMDDLRSAKLEPQ